MTAKAGWELPRFLPWFAKVGPRTLIFTLLICTHVLPKSFHQTGLRQHRCYYTLTKFYYSDWAGGYINASGQGEPLRCPDGRTSLLSHIDYNKPDLPDVFHVYPDIVDRPGDYYRIWMVDGDVHDPTAERAGKLESGHLVSTGECAFPDGVENDHSNIFVYFPDHHPASNVSVNLTLCRAPRHARLHLSPPRRAISDDAGLSVPLKRSHTRLGANRSLVSRHSSTAGLLEVDSKTSQQSGFEFDGTRPSTGAKRNASADTSAPQGGPDPLFTLAHAAHPDGQALNLVNNTAPQPFGSSTTWGGSVVVDPGNESVFHMYASAMEGSHCGLSAWESNSRVVHAVAHGSPGGPFHVEDVAVPPYAHNPEVVFSRYEQKYLLFTLGVPNATAPRPCTPDGFPEHPRYLGAPPWLGAVSLYTSAHPSGPWRLREGGPIAYGLNANPTVWVDDHTGEITLVWGYFNMPHRPHVRHYAVARARNSSARFVRLGDLPDSLAPPSSCAPPDAPKGSPWRKCACNNEDPFLFRSPPPSRRWMLLFHQYTLATAPNNKSQPCQAMLSPHAPPDPSVAAVGGFAHSLTPDILGEWSYDYWRPAYAMAADYVGGDGDAPPLVRRERPKLLMGADGQPRWLYNGVCLSETGRGQRQCFTFGQQILGMKL